jgi:hypothetical protein
MCDLGPTDDWQSQFPGGTKSQITLIDRELMKFFNPISARLIADPISR